MIKSYRCRLAKLAMKAHATGPARYQYLVIGQLLEYRQQESPRTDTAQS